MSKAVTSLLPLYDTLEHHTQMGNSAANFPYPSDYQKAADFIYSYRGSSATFNAYRRELERLLQWCAHISHKSLQQLKRQDIEEYITFCQRPPKTWIGLKKSDRFLNKEGQRIPNPEWRPFVVMVGKVAHKAGKEPDVKDYQLSQKALQAIFAILGSFFNYLIQEEYSDFNPVAQIRQKSKFIRKQQGQAPVRRLSELQWGYVIETVEKLADKDPERYERSLFMMNALFAMYLRISELSASPRWQPQMGHFHRDFDGNWWFKTVGKGNKERDVSVSDSMLAALKRYRAFLQLPPLPTVGEMTYLIRNQRGGGPINSTRQIRVLVQECFDKAVERMQADNLGEDAEQLKAATVHWLRHTGISEDVKHRPREHVRDDAGHSSSAITDRYIDVELRARHASAKNKSIKPF